MKGITKDLIENFPEFVEGVGEMQIAEADEIGPYIVIENLFVPWSVKSMSGEMRLRRVADFIEQLAESPSETDHHLAEIALLTHYVNLRHTALAPYLGEKSRKLLLTQDHTKISEDIWRRRGPR